MSSFSAVAHLGFILENNDVRVPTLAQNGSFHAGPLKERVPYHEPVFVSDEKNFV